MMMLPVIVNHQYDLSYSTGMIDHADDDQGDYVVLLMMPLMVKVKRRPFWTSVGLVVSGIGCLLMAVPYWAHTSTDPVTNFEAAKSRSAINGFNLIKSFDCNH